MVDLRVGIQSNLIPSFSGSLSAETSAVILRASNAPVEDIIVLGFPTDKEVQESYVCNPLD